MWSTFFSKKTSQREQFERYGFCVIKQLHTVTFHSKKLPDLYQYLVNLEGGKADDQSPGSPAFAGVLEVEKVHIKVMSKVEAAVGFPLYPTYSYMRKYNQGSVLTPHKDRSACEISCTLCIGYQGDYSWPIALIDRTGAVHKIQLEPGDGLVYRGCELEHWREPADERVQNHVQVFLHYVDQNGPFEDCIFDNKITVN